MLCPVDYAHVTSGEATKAIFKFISKDTWATYRYLIHGQNGNVEASRKGDPNRERRRQMALAEKKLVHMNPSLKNRDSYTLQPYSIEPVVRAMTRAWDMANYPNKYQPKREWAMGACSQHNFATHPVTLDPRHPIYNEPERIFSFPAASTSPYTPKMSNDEDEFESFKAKRRRINEGRSDEPDRDHHVDELAQNTSLGQGEKIFTSSPLANQHEINWDDNNESLDFLGFPASEFLDDLPASNFLTLLSNVQAQESSNQSATGTSTMADFEGASSSIATVVHGTSPVRPPPSYSTWPTFSNVPFNSVNGMRLIDENHPEYLLQYPIHRFPRPEDELNEPLLSDSEDP
jgi:hypothetical protein